MLIILIFLSSSFGINSVFAPKKNQVPIADVGGPYSGTEGAAISFDGSASQDTDADGTINAYFWAFGDGETSTDQNPTHIYAQEGTYTVTLTVTDDDSETDNDTTSATVSDLEPVANFIASPTSGIMPLTVTFIDTTTSYDGVVSWLWEFGDGKSSTEPNPTHIYVVGSFTVSLTVEEEDGDTNTQTKPNFIKVEHPPNLPPTADFIIVSSAIPAINEPISFTDNSVDTDGSVTSWAWNFGDTTTATTQNPIHRYQSTGTYTITLIVKDDDGATGKKTKQVTIREINPPVTTSNYDGLWHNIDFTINLIATDDYSGVAETYYKINAHPTRQLSVDGPPIITTEDSNNTLEYWSVDKIGNEETHHIILDIKLDKTPPTADPGEDIAVAEDTLITLDGLKSKDNIQITNYTWTLLDGTYQELNGKNPQYIFHTPGVYTVNLIVTDAAKNSAMNHLIITVTDVTNPIANAGDDKVINEGTSAIFNGSVSTDNVEIASYKWNFLDDSPQTLIGVDPIYTFSSAGIYEITLTVSDAQGNFGTDILLITVIDSKRPVADAGSDQIIMEDTLVNFNGSASTDNVGIVSYVWIFTDGELQTLYGEKTSYVFKNLGVYLVSLTVSDAEGHSSNDTITIIVTDNTALSIDEDDDADGMSDEWESIPDLDPLDPLDAAVEGNGDGMNNIEEYQNDANPKVYESEDHILASVLVVAVTISMIGYGILYSRSMK